MKKILFLFLSVTLFVACSKSDGNRISPKSPNQTDPTDATSSENNDNPSGDGDNGASGTSLNDITSDFLTLMSAEGFVGAQVAITRNEKLVYLKSFGTADETNGLTVNDRSLFRIASISKPITLMAISKLVAENKLKTSDFVFGADGILGTKYGKPPYEPLEESIRVSHLIDHKAGFTNVPIDIMFDDGSLSHADLIGKVLDERSLAETPGDKYDYSNFGYCLLGRIIEEVTGKSYEQYVLDEILSAMDINDMKIGGNTPEDVFPGEVAYYSSWASPYGMNVNRMDSHGGWIASAESLARLAVYNDTRGSIPDLLPSDEALSYLGSGNWNHNGALPGTLSVLQVGHPISYAVVVNTGNSDFNELIQVIRSFMNEKTSDRSGWPNSDLFDQL